MVVLGIETSCDETAAAMVADGNCILSSIISSQVSLHHPYGGVVPELASRKHIEAIVSVVDQAIKKAHMDMNQVEAIAVTQGPGLVGSLLVGFSYAKALAFARGLPWVGVNHLEGHIHSVFLEADPPPFPFVALLASGGHTCIYHVTSHLDMTMLGQTMDDAAGEAFDKVAKMLGLGYPGGEVIDRISRQGDPKKIVFPRSYLDKSYFDFSFSGIKTAVKRYIQTHPKDCSEQVEHISAGFQESVLDVLIYKVIHAARHMACAHIAIVGGVAANSRLREKLACEAEAAGLTVHLPSINLCGDNAAMIAAAGYHHLIHGTMSRLSDDVYSRVISGG